MTTDIAADGIFVVAPQPPALHELVHLTLLIPGSGELNVRAMVVRVVTGEMARTKGAPAGVGVQFYGLGEAAREQWRQFFIMSGGAGEARPRDEQREPAATETPTSPGYAPRAAPPAAEVPEPAPSRATDQAAAEPAAAPREEDRRRAADGGVLGPPLLLYRIRPKDVEGVRIFRDTALEAGGLALVGAPPPPKESIVVVAVVHPITRAEFHVPARVVRRGGGSTAPAIRFVGVTRRTWAEFDYFAQHGAPRPSAAAEHGERDPSLTESFEETQQDLAPDDEHAHSVAEVASIAPGGFAAVDRAGRRK